LFEHQLSVTFNNFELHPFGKIKKFFMLYSVLAFSSSEKMSPAIDVACGALIA
jgi:hypothetical protein